MTVYFEYAFLENFMLDGLLLYLALRCARAKIAPLRLLLAAAVGGGEALLFPLVPLPAFCAYLVKFLGGVLLALIAAKGGARLCFITSCAFFALTFALGGLLVALYSFFGVAYEEGEGYLVESAPVALVLAAALCFALAAERAVRAFYRRRARQNDLVPCRLTVGDKTVRLTGLTDSGNLLTFRGRPVCVVSALTALVLFRGRRPVGRMRLTTVSGSRESPVFVCDSLERDGTAERHVYFTVGEVQTGEYSVILHTAIGGGKHENSQFAAGMAE